MEREKVVVTTNGDTIGGMTSYFAISPTHGEIEVVVFKDGGVKCYLPGDDHTIEDYTPVSENLVFIKQEQKLTFFQDVSGFLSRTPVSCMGTR